VAARAGLPAVEAAALRGRLVEALLAADELDEGIALLRQLLAEDRRALTAAPDAGASPATAAPSGAAGSAAAMPSVAELQALGVDLPAEVLNALRAEEAASAPPEEVDARDLAVQRMSRIASMLELGRLLQKPELVEEGLGAGREWLPLLGERESHLRDNLVEALIGAYQAQGRLDVAESLLLEHLLRLQAEESGDHRPHTQEALLQLAGVYHRAGRHADVLRVFTGSPDLGAADLSELPISAGRDAASSPHLMLADALVAGGRGEEASRILRRIIQHQPGADAAYARLEAIGGSGFAAFLDETARLDRFEERPLIWKARLQLAAGDAPAAEQTIRAAIAIDPSDGEQGKGDRMRAYAVLGDILEARGDKDQAALMRGAVAAIRLSEEADDWWAAGLLTRAVRLYEQSLLKFADAYCIQSRLALRYNELGDLAKAEEHYRRAFELMPESFGRVESHCFGCEGAFTGARAQSIADTVFARLAAEPSPRPQVFYLLGYLRSSQERFREAAESFRQAVALDPDYLNAWAKLQSLSGAIHLPAAEREAAAFAILRLDPVAKRSGPDFTGLADLRRLWGAILDAEASLPARESGPLLAFDAARRAREARRQESDSFVEGRLWLGRSENLRESLSETALFSSTTQLIEQSLGR
jgi:tetratricopeptide (TPR) repeat protein